MNTFFRICVYFSFLVILVSLSFTVIHGLDVFPSELSGEEAETYKEYVPTDLWIMASALALGAGLAVSVLTHSIVPVGIAAYSSVFWGAYISALNSLSVTSYLSDAGILGMITVGLGFLFVASVIGMLTGSG